jgi:hypothetical protein
MPEYLLPYKGALEEARSSSTTLREYLREELTHLWFEAYLQITPHPTNVVTFTHGSFDYLYDDYATLEATGVVPIDDSSESRLVAAVGFSQSSRVGRRHDDGRLRGWVGPTSETFGTGWDKGHFIARSIGGAVDGLEANVFLQRRASIAGPIARWRGMAPPIQACCVSADQCTATPHPGLPRSNSAFSSRTSSIFCVAASFGPRTIQQASSRS